MSDDGVVEEVEGAGLCNFKASLPPPAPTGGCCSILCIVVFICQMMAMGKSIRKVAPQNSHWQQSHSLPNS